MKAVDVKIQLVDGGIMPKQATEGSAGLDLFACISEKEDVYIEGIDQKTTCFHSKENSTNPLLRLHQKRFLL